MATEVPAPAASGAGLATDGGGEPGLTQEVEALRDALREAGRVNEAKTVFLATMSHEIREPMNAVLGMTRLLLETPLADDQREFVETVRDAGDALLTIINDILDLSRMEAGGLQLEQIDFDLRSLLRRAVAIVEPRLRAKGLEVRLDVAPEVPGALSGDPGRLRQVLLNLLGNAAKFTERGSVAIAARLVAEEPEGGVRLALTVSDTGVGIPEHLQNRLFTPYAQADPSVPRLYGGSGLGLTICERLVRLMGGTIELRSRPGEGTTFELGLSFARASLGRAGETRGAASVAGIRLLIVDANPTTRAMVEQHTESWSIVSRAVASGEAAMVELRAAQDHGRPFHITLIDRALPDTSGEALGRRIKASPELAATRLVMTASSGLRGDAARVSKIGFAAYLPKPVTATTLLDCLLQLADDRAAGGNGLITVHSMSEQRPPGLRILVADDNPMNCRIATLILEKAGHQIDVVHDGGAAIDAVRAASYDLVLMDVQMPDVDGLEATRRIRALPIAGAGVPIVAVTANAMTGDDRRCLDAGMDDYISKPIDRARLLGKVAQWGHRAATSDRSARETRLFGDEGLDYATDGW